MIEQYIKSYWEYYLELEEKLIESRKYVEFDDVNKKSFSIEYLNLYQVIGSEIDVVGKEIANYHNNAFNGYKNGHKNIYGWLYEVQNVFPTIENEQVIFVCTNNVIQPFAKCKIIPTKLPVEFCKEDGSPKLKLDNKRSLPGWWNKYNAVKHQRVGLVVGTSFFKEANQTNVINSLAALFLMEKMFIDKLITVEGKTIDVRESRLFKHI